MSSPRPSRALRTFPVALSSLQMEIKRLAPPAEALARADALPAGHAPSPAAGQGPFAMRPFRSLCFPGAKPSRLPCASRASQPHTPGLRPTCRRRAPGLRSRWVAGKGRPLNHAALHVSGGDAWLRFLGIQRATRNCPCRSIPTPCLGAPSGLPEPPRGPRLGYGRRPTYA